MSHETEPIPRYTIRPATLEDVEDIRQMQAESWRDTYENDDLGVSKKWLAEETASWMEAESMQKSKKHLSAVFGDPTHYYRVATERDKIVGLIHVNTTSSTTKHLWGMYTDKSTHGTGLAQKMMEGALEWVGSGDCELEVASYNARAIAFYEKYGFVKENTASELFKGKIPTVRMVRKGDKQ